MYAYIIIIIVYIFITISKQTIYTFIKGDTIIFKKPCLYLYAKIR